MKRHHQKTLSAKAPGKLILSGEHAVVSGAPAIAIAIDRYATTSITQSANRRSILFNLMNMESKTEVTLDKLKSLKSRIKSGYQGFLKGEKTIRDVLEKPFELMHYTASNVLEKLGTQTELGVDIETSSDLPIGCGFGSSAASIVSTNYALSQFFDHKDVGSDKYFEWSLDAENIQHGKSSGIDVQMAINGGIAYFDGGQRQALDAPNFKLFFINTGKPTSTTGQCVAQTQAYFNDHPEMLDKFVGVTTAMQTAISAQDEVAFCRTVRENHQLLCQLGVVPATIQSLIEKIEQAGGAAKISGAGSISGNAAGAVLIAGLSKEALEALSLPFPLESIRIVQQGVTVC